MAEERQFETLDVDDMILIESESIRGVKPSLRTPDALAFRLVLDEQVVALEKRGLIPDMAVEWSGGPAPQTSPPAVIKPLRGRGEVEVSNLERSLQDHDHENEAGCCESPGDLPEDHEKLLDVVKNIYGKNSPRE